MAGLLGAITWNLITWYFGLPSSSSQALIGGLVGAAIAGGVRVNWATIIDKVLLPMLISPFVAFALGFAMMLAIMWTFRRQGHRPRSDGVSGSPRPSRQPRWRWDTASRTHRRPWA